MASKAMQRAFSKFNKLNNLATDYAKGGDDRLGARREAKAMTQTWQRRGMQPGSMHKAKNAKPSACTIRKGGAL